MCCLVLGLCTHKLVFRCSHNGCVHATLKILSGVRLDHMHIVSTGDEGPVCLHARGRMLGQLTRSFKPTRWRATTPTLARQHCSALEPPRTQPSRGGSGFLCIIACVFCSCVLLLGVGDFLVSVEVPLATKAIDASEKHCHARSSAVLGPCIASQMLPFMMHVYAYVPC